MSGRKSNFASFAANIGVLLGLGLLAYEMRHNSDLVRAQISMERAVANMQIMADIANGGALVPIDAKLRDQVTGFPQALGWSSKLTTEERRRYQFWMYVRLVELNNDWFQCAAGLMSDQTCQKEVRESMRFSLHRFYETGIAFTRSDAEFVSVMQELAQLENLPAINDDGSWQ